MASPLVSIVIPTYNQVHGYLEASVRSALAQTYSNVEVIVSDNHSTNGAGELLAAMSDPRLRVVRPPQHIPMTEHFTFAAQQAQGAFLSFLSSDDWVFPNWLSSLMPMFEAAPDAVFGFGEIIDVRHDDLNSSNFLYRNGAMASGAYSVAQILPTMFRFDRLSSWMVGDVIRADAYRKAGGIGFGGFNYSSDWGLAVKLLELGGCVYLNQPVARYRSWGHAEGKIDSLRFEGGLKDILRAYEMMEASPALKTALAGLQPELRKAKQAKARTLTLGLFEMMAVSTVDRATLDRLKGLLLSLDSSAVTRLALGLCTPATAPAARLAYPYARAAFRSKIGRYLRGRKPAPQAASAP